MSDGAVADSVEGVVERVLFRSEGDAFAVVLVRVDGRDALVKAAGALAEAGEGQVWRLAGAVEEHPRYGERLVVTTAYPVTPGSVAGLERYLGGGRFPGVGRKVAETLVAQFGSKTFDVLASADKLKIPGLGRKKLAALRAAVREDRMRCETLAFLSGLGFGPSTAGRVFQRFGDRTVAQVREDPYVLADEVRGVGFTLADQAASALGVRGDHPSRLRAGVLHVLKQAAEQGHVAVPVDAATPRAARLLDVDVDLCADALRRAEADRRLVIDDAGGDVAYAYLPFLHAAETEAALAVKRLAERPALLAPDAPAPVEPPAMLSEEQRAAVDLLLRRPLALLTGGPGVGKTTVLRAFVDAAVAAGAKVELAAPTGRAARRLEETVGRPARTLHRMLGLLPSDAGLGRAPAQELECDALVLDETSMLDLVLFVEVLRALPPAASLVMVGDPDQLPSVGPGDVLRALLRSGAAPAARLTKIFRQDEGGLLVLNAHRVLQGRLPEPPAPGAVADYYFMERENAEDGAELIRDLVTARLPAKFGFDPREDIQVLCPMHRGAPGTERLNAALQEALNGSAPALRRGERTLRLGDRVIALRNDYVRFVANGETGRVTAVDAETRTLEADFSGKTHVYRGAEADELAPAFALSVHKAQGSEYPAVIVPLYVEHFPMLRRSVLYTAMTRARKLLILVGQKRALAAATADARRSERWTLLARRLGAQDDGAPLDD